jgi:excisionase family DNA binding protein
MSSLTQRLPIGQFSPQSSAFASHTSNEGLVNGDPFLQLIALMEQRIRYIAREEFDYLLADREAAIALADKNEQLLNVQQAAELLGVIPQTVYEWIKAGKLLSSSPNGRSIRLKRGEVLSALQSRMQPDGRRKYARRTTTLAHKRKAKEVAYA